MRREATSVNQVSRSNFINNIPKLPKLEGGKEAARLDWTGEGKSEKLKSERYARSSAAPLYTWRYFLCERLVLLGLGRCSNAYKYDQIFKEQDPPTQLPSGRRAAMVLQFRFR